MDLTSQYATALVRVRNLSEEEVRISQYGLATILRFARLLDGEREYGFVWNNALMVCADTLDADFKRIKAGESVAIPMGLAPVQGISLVTGSPLPVIPEKLVVTVAGRVPCANADLREWKERALVWTGTVPVTGPP